MEMQNLASRESCFRRSNHRDERNNMLKRETYKLLVNRKKRSYNHQNRVLSALEAIRG